MLLASKSNSILDSTSLIKGCSSRLLLSNRRNSIYHLLFVRLLLMASNYIFLAFNCKLVLWEYRRWGLFWILLFTVADIQIFWCWNYSHTTHHSGGSTYNFSDQANLELLETCVASTRWDLTKDLYCKCFW